MPSPAMSSDLTCCIIGDDVYFQPNQGVPHLPFVKELLESATGKDKDGNDILTPADLSRISSIRRADARVRNPEFSLDLFHKLFGSGKYVPCLVLLLLSC